MAVIDGRTGLEQLSADDCWDLLAATPVGRVGIIVDGRPEIYPVNHAVDDRTLVFRTDPGAKLRGLGRSPAVCYEVDGVDPGARTGWSVLVKGHATEITDLAERRRADALDLALWAGGEKVRWIRLTPTEVTGRRIRPPRD